MTDTPRLWDRRADETPKSYAAFLAYVALGARRSVREAAHQNHIKTTSTGEISSVDDTTVRTWLGWSARHKWVSRSLARDEWIARTSDDQIVSNVTACKLALTTRALDYLTANDGADFLRAARALSLHFPPIQRVADVSERIEDLSDIPDADIERMKAIRDARAREKRTDKFGGIMAPCSRASGWPHSPKTTSCAARRSSSPTDGATPGLQPSRTSKRHRDRGHQYRPAAPVSPHGMESRTRPAGTPCRDPGHGTVRPAATAQRRLTFLTMSNFGVKNARCLHPSYVRA